MESPKVRVGRLERSATWAGLHLGDSVEISETGIRGATWEFVAHVRNVESGEEWVEVVGGRPGDRKIRSFRPDRVFPPKSPTARRRNPAPLADAPRLPLD